MSELIVKVERDSVCLGDDIDAPHSYSFKVSSHSTLNDVFAHLAQKRYLASVAGKNHSWNAIIKNQSLAIIRGNNQMPEPSKLLTNQVSGHVSDGTLSIRFKYNSATT